MEIKAGFAENWAAERRSPLGRMAMRNAAGSGAQSVAMAGSAFAAMRIAVVGIGHELLGDDSAGLAVCRRLQEIAAHNSAPPSGPRPLHEPSDPRSTLLIIPAGPAPENCTAQLRRFAPDQVVLVDAARMGDRPGTARWIPWAAAEGIGGSTHSLPLRLLCEYLAMSLGCRVELLGIQPADTTLGAGLSPTVEAAVEAAAQLLAGLLHPSPAGTRAAPRPSAAGPAALGELPEVEA